MAEAGITTRGVRELPPERHRVPARRRRRGRGVRPDPVRGGLHAPVPPAPALSSLPRKFKVAFEGCPVDHAASIHDLGFVARASRTAAAASSCARAAAPRRAPVSAQVLVPLLPAGELLELSEAVIRVFHRLGDRVHRQANRMKFLVKKLGFEGFRDEVEAERARVRAEGAPRLPFDPERPGEELPPKGPRPAAPGRERDRGARPRST